MTKLKTPEAAILLFDFMKIRDIDGPPSLDQIKRHIAKSEPYVRTTKPDNWVWR